MDDIVERFAVVESQINMLMRLPEKVTKLEADYSNLHCDMKEMSQCQKESIIERQKQHETVLNKIQTLQKETNDKFDPISKNVEAVLVGMKTLLLSTTVLGILFGIYQAWPK